MQTIHGHKVIEFIDLAQPKIQKEELLERIVSKFGNVRFHTCSQQGLDASSLIDFLEQAGKLKFVKGKAYIEKANVCDHDED